MSAATNAAHRPSFEHRAALALLLAGALLICHGLLGASHVLAHDEGSPTSIGEASATGDHQISHHAVAEDVLAGHASGHAVVGQPAGGEGASVPHMGAADYFAVLLVLAGVALLGALLGGVRALARGEASRVFRPHQRFDVRSLARGPSPPLLQVFRL